MDVGNTTVTIAVKMDGGRSRFVIVNIKKVIIKPISAQYLRNKLLLLLFIINL